MQYFWNFGGFVGRGGEGRETVSEATLIFIVYLQQVHSFKLFPNAWEVFLSSSNLLSLWVDPVILL